MTDELLAGILELLHANEACKEEFFGREEELLCAAASLMLSEKEKAGGRTAAAAGRSRSKSLIEVQTGPFSKDVGSVASYVDRYQLPQVYSPQERILLKKGHEHAAEFEKNQNQQKTIRVGHRLATGDYCDTGQEVLARAKWEVRATPLELIAYNMRVTNSYSARKERGRTMIESGETRR
jgi:hypothetical protein